MAARDAGKSSEQLLADIEKACGTPNPGAALAPFGHLLVKLSRDADARSDMLLQVTNRLYRVTIGLLVLTFLLLVFTFLLFGHETFGSRNAVLDAIRPPLSGLATEGGHQVG